MKAPKKLVLDKTTIRNLSVNSGVKTGTSSWLLCGVTPGCTRSCQACTVATGHTTKQ